MDLVDGLRLTLAGGTPDVVALVGGGGKSSSLFRLGVESAARERRALITTTTQMGADEVWAAPALVEVAGPDLPLAEVARALDRHRWCLLAGPVVGPKRAGITAAQVDALVEGAPELGLSLIAVEADGSRKFPVKAPAAYEPAIPSRTTLVVPVVGIDGVGRAISADAVHRPEQVRAVLGLAPEDARRLAPAHLATLMLDPRGGDKDRPPAARRVALVNKVARPEEFALARLVAAHWTAAGVPGLIAAVGEDSLAPVRERWAPVAVVVLAAGQARRMGRAKQLEVVDGVSMVRRALQVALASGAHQVVLVTGAHAGGVAGEVAPLAAAHPHLTVVHNPAWATGQARSMQVGLAALRPEVEAALFLPVDQPFLPAALLRRLAAHWRQGAAIVAPVVDGELRGAPALFDRTLWPDLMAVSGDIGGRPVLRRHAAAVHTVDAAAAWLRDMDTPADLAGW